MAERGKRRANCDPLRLAAKDPGGWQQWEQPKADDDRDRAQELIERRYHKEKLSKQLRRWWRLFFQRAVQVL